MSVESRWRPPAENLLAAARVMCCVEASALTVSLRHLGGSNARAADANGALGTVSHPCPFHTKDTRVALSQ
jgi:hypothetical protein